MSETHPCSGGCGLRLDKPDSICLTCWNPRLVSDPPRSFPEASSDLPLELQIMANAYKLAFSQIPAERDEAIEALAHLITQLKEKHEV